MPIIVILLLIIAIAVAWPILLGLTVIVLGAFAILSLWVMLNIVPILIVTVTAIICITCAVVYCIILDRRKRKVIQQANEQQERLLAERRILNIERDKIIAGVDVRKNEEKRKEQISKIANILNNVAEKNRTQFINRFVP